MKYREEYDGSYLVCMEIGDEIIDCLIKFARDEGIRGAHLKGVGAIDLAEIGFFDIDRKDYIRKTIEGQREMLSLIGNIGVTSEGEIAIHVHVVLGDNEMNCTGGHLFSGRISVTGEIIIHPTDDIVRTPDNRTGLKLWNLKLL